MRVLLINNYHYLRGGAERCYFDTGKILEENGHAVAYFSTTNRDNLPCKWSKYFVQDSDLSQRYGLSRNLKIAGRIIYNCEAKRKLEELIKEFKPEVAHLHNIHHHLSPSIIDALKKHNVPIAMTLHDYKLISPNYNLYSRGKIYEKALNGAFYRCIWDKCIKDSYLASFVCTVEAYLHKWLRIYKKIDAFISPSEFLAEKFEQAGFGREISYLPNPYYGESQDESGQRLIKSRYILYFGRLSEEKGVRDLLEAFFSLENKEGIKLVITGTGPLEEELKGYVTKRGMNDAVIFTGYKSGKDLINIVKNAEFVVMPSRWQENAPYSLIEAMALTKCVLCAKMGGFTDLIIDGINGFFYEPGNVSDLRKKLNIVINYPILEKVGENAKKTIEKHNSKEKYYSGLMNLYKKL